MLTPLVATTAGASRTNERHRVKSKLFLKFIGGPKIGLLQANREPLTEDLEQLVGQILRALRTAGVPTMRGDLRLLARRFGAEYAVVDGIFAGPCGRGYFMYGPTDMRRGDVEIFLIGNLNLVPFFLAHADGDNSRLFSEDVLPSFPEFPAPIISLWSAETGATALCKTTEFTTP